MLVKITMSNLTIIQNTKYSKNIVASFEENSFIIKLQLAIDL